MAEEILGKKEKELEERELKLIKIETDLKSIASELDQKKKDLDIKEYEFQTRNAELEAKVKSLSSSEAFGRFLELFDEIYTMMVPFLGADYKPTLEMIENVLKARRAFEKNSKP